MPIAERTQTQPDTDMVENLALNKAFFLFGKITDGSTGVNKSSHLFVYVLVSYIVVVAWVCGGVCAQRKYTQKHVQCNGTRASPPLLHTTAITQKTINFWG